MQVFTLAEAAQVFDMTMNALKVYLSIHKEMFSPKQYRTSPGKPGRYRILSPADISRLEEIRKTEQPISPTSSRFDWRITEGAGR